MVSSSHVYIQNCYTLYVKKILAGLVVILIAVVYILLDIHYNGPQYTHEIYSNQSIKEDTEQDLDTVQIEPRWASLVTIHIEECDVYSSIGTPSKPDFMFMNVVQSVKASVDVPEGKLILVPCISEMYNLSDLIVLDDGTSYEVISISYIDNSGVQQSYYPAEHLKYNPETKIFTNFAAHGPETDCGAESTFKYVDREMVLQKYIVKKECGDTLDDTEVLYDINQNQIEVSAIFQLV